VSRHEQVHTPSFFFTTLLTSWGLAWPWVAFITWPTNPPRALSRWSQPSFVHLLAVADGENQNHESLLLDPADEPIGPDAVAPEAMPAATEWPAELARIVGAAIRWRR
jgi:hypothetical protein